MNIMEESDSVMDYIYRKVLNLRYLYFILFCLTLLLVLVVIPLEVIEYLFDLNPAEENPISDSLDKNGTLVLVLIIGPLIETLIFQVGLMLGLRLIFSLLLGDPTSKANRVLLASSVVVSVCFGASHIYSIVYMCITTYIGLFFCLLYFLSVKRGDHPFIPIFVSHSLYNLIILILQKGI